MASPAWLSQEVQASTSQASGSGPPSIGPSTPTSTPSSVLGTATSKGATGTASDAVQDHSEANFVTNPVFVAHPPSFSYNVHPNVNSPSANSQQPSSSPVIKSNSPGSSAFLQPPVPGCSGPAGPSFSYNISHGGVGFPGGQQFQSRMRGVDVVKDGRNGTHTEVREEIKPLSEFVEERRVDEVESKPQGNESPTEEIGATSSDFVQELLQMRRIVDEGEGEPQGNGTPTKETGATSSNFVQERAVDEGDDHEEPGFTSIDHEERGADEGEHQTDATPSHLREEGGATSSEIVKERVVDEDDELREEAKVSSSAQTHEEVVMALECCEKDLLGGLYTGINTKHIVRAGNMRGADEGEHQTDATPSHLREEGDATSSEIVEKEQY